MPPRVGQNEVINEQLGFIIDYLAAVVRFRGFLRAVCERLCALAPETKRARQVAMETNKPTGCG